MCFCKKYEEQLINAKEVEVNQLEMNKRKDVASISKVDPAETEIRQRRNVHDRSLKTKSDLEFEEALKYWNNQIAGWSKL